MNQTTMHTLHSDESFKLGGKKPNCLLIETAMEIR